MIEIFHAIMNSVGPTFLRILKGHSEIQILRTRKRVRNNNNNDDKSIQTPKLFKSIHYNMQHFNIFF